MAVEQFTNQPTTSVSSGGTTAPASGTTESWTVASSATFPGAVLSGTQFHVYDTAAGMSSELILVRNVSGTTWSVTRGAEGTTPVAHTTGFTITQSVTAGWLSALPSWKILPSATYGGVPDGRVVNDAVTNGTTTVTSATAAFTSGDTGKLVVLCGTADGDAAAGNYFAATCTYVSATQITLASAPSFTETAVGLAIGTDNHTAISAWLTAAAGGRAYAPQGLYLSSGTHTIPDRTLMSGDGYDTEGLMSNYFPQYGTAFIFGGTGNPAAFFTAGGSGYNAQVRDLCIDGANLCQSALLVTGARANVINAMVQRGIYHALQVNGGDVWITDSYVAQQNAGDVIYCSGSDAHIKGNILRQPGSGGACCHVVNVSDFLFTANHSFSGYNGVVSSSYPCNNIKIDNSGSGADVDNIVITGNLFDGVYGHAINLNPTGGSSARISDITITGNSFFAVSGFPAGTFSVVYAGTSSGNNVRGLTITGNAVRGYEGSVDNWEYLLGYSGTGTLQQVTVADNAGMGVAAMWPSSIRPDGGREGNVFTATNTSGTSIMSSNDGTATFSGTGSATTFAITHNLAAAPTTVTLTAGSSAAAAPSYWTASSSTITVTYLTAPASGTNNVVLSWSAVI